MIAMTTSSSIKVNPRRRMVVSSWGAVDLRATPQPEATSHPGWCAWANLAAESLSTG
jgi:hypothetical protein